MEDAEKAVSEGALLPVQVAINQVVDEFQLYRPGTAEQLHDWWKQRQPVERRIEEVDLPCQR